MSRFLATRTIAAPVDVVFKTVADIEQFSQAIPKIVKIEFLSSTRSGLGTRFRETRRMNGNEIANDLEVTEWSENERIRLVADSHGTIWDTLFTVAPGASGGTLLTMTMDANAHKWTAKIMNVLIAGMVKREVESDLDAVKAFCERPPGSRTV